jgi:hypothetical protein
MFADLPFHLRAISMNGSVAVFDGEPPLLDS